MRGTTIMTGTTPVRESTPPTPELNMSFDSEDRGGVTDEETGKTNRSVGFASAISEAPAHPLAVDAGHCRDGSNVSELGASNIYSGRSPVGSSILSSPEAVLHMRNDSHDSNVIEKSEHIRGKHVRNVFRGSVTVGTVNYEQIERIKKSELIY